MQQLPLLARNWTEPFKDYLTNSSYRYQLPTVITLLTFEELEHVQET